MSLKVTGNEQIGFFTAVNEVGQTAFYVLPIGDVKTPYVVEERETLIRIITVLADTSLKRKFLAALQNFNSYSAVCVILDGEDMQQIQPSGGDFPYADLLKEGTNLGVTLYNRIHFARLEYALKWKERVRDIWGED